MKIKATKVHWKTPSNKPHYHNGQPSCYYESEVIDVKNAAGTEFNCFGFYIGKDYDDDTQDLVYVIALDANNSPLVNDRKYLAAVPCPPHCPTGDQGGEGNPETQDLDPGTCIEDIAQYYCE